MPPNEYATTLVVLDLVASSAGEQVDNVSGVSYQIGSGNMLEGLDEAARLEILHPVRRVADKLLHEPTVRVKELSNDQGAASYAAALAELFALDPEAVVAVTRPEGLT